MDKMTCKKCGWQEFRADPIEEIPFVRQAVQTEWFSIFAVFIVGVMLGFVLTMAVRLW